MKTAQNYVKVLSDERIKLNNMLIDICNSKSV